MLNLRLQLRLFAASVIRYLVIALMILTALLIGAALFFVGFPLIILIILIFALSTLAGCIDFGVR
ncbi:hypothetical protein HJB53_30355 [Rhizobium lentis]|uniref:hypothetical protein n=1 Tax=Rhizobium lentis TaxID=1138194 RepID=UPI001C83B1E7|nr:hypothetical protein [Rhizobium lentis]MBX5130795.1 hypothetical protein [Rhizobium lentis]